MNYFLVGIGGSGARCMEAFVHMNAAGLMNPSCADSIKLIYVDPDGSNGNLHDTIDVVNHYNDVMSKMKQQQNFFKNELKVVGAEDKGGKDPVWNPIGITSNTTLIKVLGTPSDEEKDLFDCLFTDEEQQTNLDKGFRAHPAIGAAAIGEKMSMDDGPWKELGNAIGSTETRVFFFGSVFGGTGASGIPNIAKIIRAAAKEKGATVRLGGCLLLPYFNFGKASAEDQLDEKDGKTKIIVPDHSKFHTNTYAALNYYHEDGLVGDVFDAAYLIGDNNPVNYGKYCAGGKAQKNTRSYLEMISALAAFDFFNKNDKNYFDEPKSYMLAIDGIGEKGCITWDDLPAPYEKCLLKNKLKSFIRFIYACKSFVYPRLDACYFVEGAKSSEDGIAKTQQSTKTAKQNNPWIGKFLGYDGGFLGFGIGKLPRVTERDYEAAKALKVYVEDYLSWLKDISESSYRCERFVSPKMFIYDDSKTYEQNEQENNIVTMQDLFGQYDDEAQTYGYGPQSFLQIVTETNGSGEGFSDLIAYVYNICCNNKEVN